MEDGQKEIFKAKRPFRRLPETIKLGRLAVVSGALEGAGITASALTGDLTYAELTSYFVVVQAGIVAYDGSFDDHPTYPSKFFRKPEPRQPDFAAMDAEILAHHGIQNTNSVNEQAGELE